VAPPNRKGTKVCGVGESESPWPSLEAKRQTKKLEAKRKRKNFGAKEPGQTFPEKKARKAT